MFEYLLGSFVLHSILLILLLTPELNTSSKTVLTVDYVNKSSTGRDQKPFKSPTVAKPLIPGPGASKSKKQEKVDMTQYANQLKAVVDPVWVSHVQGLQSGLHKKYSTIVLLFPDHYGNIVSIRVVKGSGDSTLDALAIQTFREVGQIPIPPESLIKEGIEWEFSIGG